MFESIRRLVKGWFGYAIMAGICLTFALWGVADYLGVGKPPVAAVVNGEEITTLEISRQVERLQQTRASDLPDLPNLKRQLLSELVTERLLLQNAEDEHLKVSDKTILQYVQSRPEFQDENGFSNAIFQSLLSQNELTPSTFIDVLKKDILKNQLRDALSQTGFITPYEMSVVFDLMEQSRDVRYARLKLEDFAVQNSLSEAMLEQHYQLSRDQYIKPEEVTVEYIELKRDHVKAGIQIDPNEVEKYFTEHKSDFRSDEKRTIAHILVAKNDAAESTINKIQAALTKGDSFSSLVKAYSTDTISAERDGELGTFTKLSLPEGFSEYVFAVKNSGEHTEAFETDFGWHIVKVLAIEDAKQMSFSEAKMSIEQRMLEEALNNKMLMLEEDLAQLTFEVPSTLVEAAEALALKVNTTKAFTRNTGQGIFNDPKVSSVVFSDEVLIEKNNSSVIKLSNDHLVVLRAKDYTPEKILPFAEVKGRVEFDLSEKLKKENAQVRAKEIIEQLLHSQNESDVQQLPWSLEENVTRNDERLPFPLISVVFQKPVNPNYYWVEELANGDIAIVSVLKRDQKLLSAERKREAAYSTALASRASGLEFLLFANSLEQASDIVLKDTL